MDMAKITMNEKKVQEIMNKIIKGWRKRHGQDIAFDPLKVAMVEETLRGSPHEDGLMRVTNMESPDVTHLVPMEYIILNGLKGNEVNKFPIEK